MPNPNSEILDIRDGISPLVPARLAVWPDSARGPARRIWNAICALLARYLAWRARQVTLRVLSRLDAATLRDLGITDVESAVNGDPAGRMRGYEPDWWRRPC
jgi:uncharacterized protein YjiS (DUF1127 family)